ncbi:MAG: hypothetical protein WDN24_02290 [Sphingomonas sp.]
MPDDRPKRAAPFCLRLSADERARLERDAGGIPLGTFIKARLLNNDPATDRKFAARTLATFGQIGTLDYLLALDEACRAGEAFLPPRLQQPLPGLIDALRRFKDWLLRILGVRGAS